MSERECLLCGKRMGEWDDTEMCGKDCLDAWSLMAAQQFPIAIGHAIARFVRRAEVAGLVERVEAKLQYSVICDYGSAEYALSRLARLAGGGA